MKNFNKRKSTPNKKSGIKKSKFGINSPILFSKKFKHLNFSKLKNKEKLGKEFATISKKIEILKKIVNIKGSNF